MNDRLNELREKHPRWARELDLVSGRVSHETGLVNPEHKPDDIQDWMEKCVLEVLDLINQQGHSGFTHGYMLNLLIPLLQDRPITPLTGKDWEWRKCHFTDVGVYQNTRCFSVFKDGEDEQAYYTNAYAFSDDGGETYYTSRDSYKDIDFPCKSDDLKTEYIILEEKS